MKSKLRSGQRKSMAGVVDGEPKSAKQLVPSSIEEEAVWEPM